MKIPMIELLGYLATITTIVSMLFSIQIRLRAANLIACMIWVIYGIQMNAMPIIIVNSIIFIIHSVWLIRNRKGYKNAEV